MAINIKKTLKFSKQLMQKIMEAKIYNIEKIDRCKAYDAPVIDVSKEKGIVRAYINKFNVPDTYNEMSLNGSFQKTFRERLKKMWWLLNHEWENSLGVTLSLEEDQIGAIATGKFNLEKQISKDVFSDYLFFADNGRTLQHSIRVIPIKYIIENDIMKVLEWKMSEWSTLTRPGAIEDTPMISIKEAKEEIDMLKKSDQYPFSDEKLKEFEEKISRLESLITKAEEITLKHESTRKINETIKFINELTF
jgi:HK97 family phage prohead protease